MHTPFGDVQIVEESVLLLNMTFLLLVGAICSIIFKKLKMPTIIGYLVTGIILANYWVGESTDTETIVTLLSDLGLVLLMFCIGMELNLKKLRKAGIFALVVVLIQVPLMIVGGYLFGLLLGFSSLQAIFFGAIISGSSTAVVTTVLKGQDKISKDDIETIVIVTVVEDIAQVLILSMASPLLVGTAMSVDSIIWMLAIIIAFMIISMAVGLMFVPRILDWLGHKMPEEVLLVASLGMCFGMAFMSVAIGMSMAIGAFMMGIVVSQSKTKTIIERDVTPMKDIFMAMFFISIGLEISASDLLANIGMVFAIFLIYAFLKTSSVFIAYFIGDKPLKLSFLSSISLVAMGEFAFIIAKAALDADVVSQSFYTSVIGAALVSMILLPIISKNGEEIYDFIDHHAPKIVHKTVHRMEDIRDDKYAKIALSSKTTISKFKRGLTLAYFELLVVFVLEFIFYVFTDSMTRIIFENTSLSYYNCYIIVLFLNFLILLLPLYEIIKNIKFVEKVMVDIERRAEAIGKGNLKRRQIRVFQEFIKVNTWLVVFFADFIFLMAVPNNVEFWDHFLVMLGGSLVVLAIYFYKYWIRS